MRFLGFFALQMIFISPSVSRFSDAKSTRPEGSRHCPKFPLTSQGKEKTSPLFREEVLLVLFHFAADFRRPVLCEIRDPEYRSRHLPECFL